MARGRFVRWLRWDANASRNPKLLSVKADGMVLYLRGLEYCAEHETDGLIPKHVIPWLVADFVDLELWSARRRKPVDNSPEPVDNSPETEHNNARLSAVCPPVVRNVTVTESVTGRDSEPDGLNPGGMSDEALARRRRRLVKRLVDAGLWHANPHGYEVNDYLQYQPERSEIEERDERRRAQARERKRRERARKRGQPLSADCPNVTHVTPYTLRGYSLRNNPQEGGHDFGSGSTPALEGAGAPPDSSPTNGTTGADEARKIIERLRAGSQMP